MRVAVSRRREGVRGVRPPFAFSAEASDLAGAKIDAGEIKDTIDITTEFPGVENQDTELILADGLPTIRSEKNTERDENSNKNWYVVAQRGAFSLSIALPFEPASDTVEATFDRGRCRIRPNRPGFASKQQKIDADRGAGRPRSFA